MKYSDELAKRRKWYKKRMEDPEYAKREQVRRRVRHRERKYGISQEQFDEMADAQGYRCLICRRKKKLGVDHDHESGIIRGLLCFRCNSALGGFNDNPVLLKAAINYLMGKE